MPLSTSSSSTRTPSMCYGRIWLFVCITVVCLFAIGDFVFRSQGYRPSVLDCARLWAIHRADVYEKNNRSRIVIAGSSRAQLGLVPSVLEEQFPDHKVKLLAISGAPSFEVVKELCEDEDFNGTILWSTSAGGVFPLTDENNKGVLYSQFFREEFKQARSIQDNINSRISTFLQSHIVVLSPYLSLGTFVGDGFQPAYVNFLPNRYCSMRYRDGMTDVQLAANRKKRIELIGKWDPSKGRMDTKRFESLLRNELIPLHRLLLARGGEIVLIRMPTTDEHWESDNKKMPKDTYWDRIESITGIPTIHFADYPDLANFDCPDTSHLDATDAPEFTRRLSKILKESYWNKHTP